MGLWLGLAQFVVAAVIRVRAGVCSHGAVDWCRTAAAHRQVQQTGAGGQVDVLDVFYLGAAHWTRLHADTQTKRDQIDTVMMDSYA